MKNQLINIEAKPPLCEHTSASKDRYTAHGEGVRTRHFRLSGSSLLFRHVVLLSLGLLTSQVDAAQRPISDFLSRQGKFCFQLDANGFFDCSASHYVSDTTGGGCVLFLPPAANYTGWSDPNAGLTVSFDYAGLANAALGGSLGTTFGGSIDEVPQADGTVIVKVVLQTRNALAFAVPGLDFSGPLLFGNRVTEVLGGAPASIGSCTLKLVFRNAAPGAPLPDVDDLLTCSFADLISISLTGQADGTLASSQPGHLEVTEVGLIATAAKANPKSRVAFDAFPAEHIIIRATGK